jgi:hypothetical protein
MTTGKKARGLVILIGFAIAVGLLLVPLHSQGTDLIFDTRSLTATGSKSVTRDCGISFEALSSNYPSCQKRARTQLYIAGGAVAFALIAGFALPFILGDDKNRARAASPATQESVA